MKLSIPLLSWLCRQALPVTLIAVPTVVLFALFSPAVLDQQTVWIVVFILGHSWALAAVLGRPTTGAFAFLHSRGFGRDRLWLHLWLTTAILVAAAWLPAAILVWSGIRSNVQDLYFQSPYFPIMAPRETNLPLEWLGWFALFLPAFHYAWMRSVQPSRGWWAGSAIAAGLVVAVVALFNTGFDQRWFEWLRLVGLTAVSLAAFIGTRLTYPRMEVRA